MSAAGIQIGLRTATVVATDREPFDSQSVGHGEDECHQIVAAEPGRPPYRRRVVGRCQRSEGLGHQDLGSLVAACRRRHAGTATPAGSGRDRDGGTTGTGVRVQPGATPPSARRARRSEPRSESDGCRTSIMDVGTRCFVIGNGGEGVPHYLRRKLSVSPMWTVSPGSQGDPSTGYTSCAGPRLSRGPAASHGGARNPKGCRMPPAPSLLARPGVVDHRADRVFEPVRRQGRAVGACGTQRGVPRPAVLHLVGRVSRSARTWPR